MSKAIIVFADGSKQMAHNTDDLRFRWYERKTYDPIEVMETHREGIYVRDCSEPHNLAEAKSWRLELSQQKAILEGQLRTLRNSPYFKSHTHPHLARAMTEVMAQQTLINERIRGFNTVTPDDIDARRARQHAQKMERIAAANDEQRQKNVRLRAALECLYNAVSAAQVRGCIENYEDLQGAMAVASEFVPTTNDSE